MTFLKCAEEILQDAEYPLSYKEIWKCAEERGLAKKLISSGKTPIRSLAARLYVNIRDKADSIFMFASKKPTTFWLKARERELANLETKINENNEKEELGVKELNEGKKRFNERDLHPLLVKFLKDSKDNKFNAYAKTIYHEKSTKNQKGVDKWNFPDIVAVHFPFDDYTEDALNLAKNINQSKPKIYSFELKIALSWGNLKESYFQAVSNSSWANEGYLVVFEEIDNEILDEIKRLNQSFGIGLIQLGLENIECILNAKERELDFETIEMLIEKNKDFKEFIQNVNKDFKTNDKDRIAIQNYDKILDDEKLENYIENKKITQD